MPVIEIPGFLESRGSRLHESLGVLCDIIVALENLREFHCDWRHREIQQYQLAQC